MTKKTLAGLLVGLLLCSCTNMVNNEYNQQEGGSSRFDSENSEMVPSSSSEASSAIPSLIINWGDYSDSLKRFDDHDGRKNNYKDYVMTEQVKMNGNKSRTLLLSADKLGSDFLTDFQEREIVKERPTPPGDEAMITLSVTELGVTYQYILFEGGSRYTVQNGKTYYLGTSTDSFQSDLMTFVVEALDIITAEQAGAPKLPLLDPWGYHSLPDSEGDDSKHKTDLTPDKYDVVIIFLTDSGELGIPVLIKNVSEEEKILYYLNNTNIKETIDVVTGGGGPVIRVFNKDECYNYMLRGEQLIDYQNEMVYRAPDELFKCIQMSVAYELVCLLEE